MGWNSVKSMIDLLLADFSYLLMSIKLAFDRRENRVDAQVAHASMMFQRTFALLAWSAFEFQLEMLTSVITSFTPGDMGRPKKRHNRRPERSREMPRTRIRGDEQIGTANGRLGQADTERRICQAEDGRMSGIRRDPASIVSLGRTADNQNDLIQLPGDTTRQFCKVFARPVLCRTKGSAGIQANERG